MKLFSRKVRTSEKNHLKENPLEPSKKGRAFFLHNRITLHLSLSTHQTLCLDKPRSHRKKRKRKQSCFHLVRIIICLIICLHKSL